MGESGLRAELTAGNRSVSRALDILELLADSECPLSLADVAKRLDLPPRLLGGQGSSTTSPIYPRSLTRSPH
ncbi:helix-turn-helix domain-containing protein [Streptomyces mirabilis]|uniref:helix-turn-helix domain-containing protein n=1 Tax=Streptomyces mirabilis TaxID=68239 RepID=UPI0036F0E6AF